MLIFWILFISISNQVNIIHADNQHIMGSTYQIKEKLKQEINFLKELKSYLKLLKEKVTHVEKFLNDNYYDTEDVDIENLENDTILEDYVSNPINAFGIIKRTHEKNLDQLNLESNISSKVNSNLTEFIKDAPEIQDFYAATESIALIQVCT